jgi:3-hydroxy-3-methylglutaryl CoA synthase
MVMILKTLVVTSKRVISNRENCCRAVGGSGGLAALLGESKKAIIHDWSSTISYVSRKERGSRHWQEMHTDGDAYKVNVLVITRELRT